MSSTGRNQKTRVLGRVLSPLSKAKPKTQRSTAECSSDPRSSLEVDEGASVISRPSDIGIKRNISIQVRRLFTASLGRTSSYSATSDKKNVRGERQQTPKFKQSRLGHTLPPAESSELFEAHGSPNGSGNSLYDSVKKDTYVRKLSNDSGRGANFSTLTKRKPSKQGFIANFSEHRPTSLESLIGKPLAWRSRPPIVISSHTSDTLTSFHGEDAAHSPLERLSQEHVPPRGRGKIYRRRHFSRSTEGEVDSLGARDIRECQEVQKHNALLLRKPSNKSENFDSLGDLQRFKNARVSTFHESVKTDTLRPGKPIRQFREQYKCLKTLIGAGGYGTVELYSCRKTVKTNYTDGHLSKGRIVAVKSMFKKELPKRDLKDFRDEYHLMKNLRHKNVLKVYDFFEDDRKFIMVMEYINGGSLIKRISGIKSYTEKDARFILRQTIKGMKYVHASGIVHRDLKPENILVRQLNLPDEGVQDKEKNQRSKNVLLSNNLKKIKVTSLDDSQLPPGGGIEESITLFEAESNYEVVICDFGISAMLPLEEMKIPNVLDDPHGTPGYAAPEKLSTGHYGAASDVYSTGIVAHMLLSGGERPYGLSGKETAYEMEIATQHRDLSFNTAPWINITEEAKNLVSMMLEKNPEKRPTFEQLLGHKWFVMDDFPLNAPITTIKYRGLVARQDKLEENDRKKFIISSKKERFDASSNPQSAVDMFNAKIIISSSELEDSSPEILSNNGDA